MSNYGHCIMRCVVLDPIYARISYVEATKGRFTRQKKGYGPLRKRGTDRIILPVYTIDILARVR